MIRKSVFCLTVFFAIAMVGSGFAQSSLTDTARAAVGVNPESGSVKSLGPQARHAVVSDLIEEDSGTSGPSSIKGNPGGLPGILSVPNFTRSFTFGGQDFPYTMMGNDPSLGHKTIVPTKFIAVSLELQNADLVTTTTVPVGEFEQPTLNSPNFQRFKYEHEGEPVQFGDAIQRAEFFSTMKENWHTELSPVNIVDRVTIHVPRFVTVIRRINGVNTPVQARTYFTGLAPDGHTFVLLLNLFFNQQLGIIMNNEINAGNATTDALNTLLLPNTFLFSLGANPGVAPGGCCTLGFHTFFFDPSADPTPVWLTIFASWTSPDLFGGGTADVTPLSHEISETFNDPFLNNIVPVWQFPGIPGACQDNLETGDPVEVLANTVFPVTLKNKGQEFTYHAQTEALLQWFAHTVPSDAIHGAYSYPDLTALQSPSTLCH